MFIKPIPCFIVCNSNNPTVFIFAQSQFDCLLFCNRLFTLLSSRYPMAFQLPWTVCVQTGT